MAPDYDDIDPALDEVVWAFMEINVTSVDDLSNNAADAVDLTD